MTKQAPATKETLTYPKAQQDALKLITATKGFVVFAIQDETVVGIQGFKAKGVTRNEVAAVYKSIDEFLESKRIAPKLPPEIDAIMTALGGIHSQRKAPNAPAKKPTQKKKA